MIKIVLVDTKIIFKNDIYNYYSQLLQLLLKLKR